MIKIKKIISPRHHSLKLGMLYAAVIGMLIAVAVFLGLRIGATALVDSNYLSAEKKAEREADYYKDIARYIEKKGLTMDNVSSGLAKWQKSNRYVFLACYSIDGLLIYDTGTGGEPVEGETGGENVGGDEYYTPGLTTGKLSQTEILKALEERRAENGGAILNTKDGSVHVIAAEYTEYIYYDIINIASVVIAMIMLIVIIMLCFGRMTRRIRRLADEVTVVADGNMTHDIARDGNDEIGKLSQKVESMRNTMLENLAREREAMDANAELITAMSHDIRTPLTVLLGYLDVMKLNADDAVMKEYISASEKTALRLKKMSDDMFNYFLVFGAGGEEAQLQRYDAPTLIDQLLAEHVLLMHEQGYIIEHEISESLSGELRDVAVYTDAAQLIRIIENVFSNMYKYADKSSAVSINCELDGDRVVMTFKNTVSAQDKEVQSTGIGLRTCKKISEIISCDFSAERVSDGFVVRIGLPAVRGELPADLDGAGEADR